MDYLAFDYKWNSRDLRKIIVTILKMWLANSVKSFNYVKDYYIKKDINGALNFLYKEASKRWIIEEEVIDDITLILIFFE